MRYAISIAFIVVASSAFAAGEDLCAGRAGCSVTATHDAGTGEGGVKLTVYELAIQNAPDAEIPCRPHRQEFWVVAGEAKTKILSLCNDGYGAAGVGEDTVEVGPNKFSHSQYGGSAWRWSTDSHARLSPFRVLSQESCSYHNIAPGFDVTEWNLENFSVKMRSLHLKCGADGGIDLDAPGLEEMELGCAPEKATREYIPIPQVSVSLPAGREAGISVGDCGVRADSSGKQGYLIHGKAGAASDASLSAVFVSETRLVVTVVDDRFVQGGTKWLYDDHLEIWTGGFSQAQECEGFSGDVATQWALFPLDSSIIKAAGPDQPAPTVKAQLNTESPSGPTPMTFVIDFPERPWKISVVYSDSDDGRSQERLIATSPVKFGDYDTLGTQIGAPGGTVCSVHGDKLMIDSMGGIEALPQTDQ